LGLVVAGRKTNKQTKKSKKEFQICVPFTMCMWHIGVTNKKKKQEILLFRNKSSHFPLISTFMAFKGETKNCQGGGIPMAP
jgi:hypothetical protein